MRLSSKGGLLFDYLELKQVKIFYAFFYFFLLVLLILRICVVFSYHGQLAGVDNNFDYPVMRLLHSLSIYPDPENYPFAVNPYGPLFFYASWSICLLTGVSANDGIQIYFVTRGLCLLFDCITFLMLFRLASRYLNISKRVALFSSLFFFYVISYWGYTMNRSDSLVLMWFSIIILLLFSKQERKSGTFWLAILCTAAIFSKQNAIITPALVIIVLIYFRRWKQIWLFIGLFIVTFSGFFYFFTRLFPNGNFIAHFSSALNNRIDLKWYYTDILKRLAESFIIIPFAMGVFLSTKWIIKSQDKKIVALSFITIIATAWGFALALKWGSHVGYLQESLFCVTCILAYAAAGRKEGSLPEKLPGAALFILSIIYIHILLQIYFYYVNDRKEEKKQYAVEKDLANNLLKELNGNNKYIFAYTDPYNDFFKVLLQGKSVLPNIDAVSCCTWPDKRFNYAKLKEGFLNGNIEFIIFESRHIYPSYFDVQFNKYIYYKTFDKYTIFRFNN